MVAFLDRSSRFLPGVSPGSDVPHFHVHEHPPPTRRVGSGRIAISSPAIASARYLAECLHDWLLEDPSIWRCCRPPPSRRSEACSTIPIIPGGTRPSSCSCLRPTRRRPTSTGSHSIPPCCSSATGRRNSQGRSLSACRRSCVRAWMVMLPACSTHHPRYAIASKRYCRLALTSLARLSSMSAKRNSLRHWPRHLPAGSPHAASTSLQQNRFSRRP